MSIRTDSLMGKWYCTAIHYFSGQPEQLSELGLRYLSAVRAAVWDNNSIPYLFWRKSVQYLYLPISTLLFVACICALLSLRISLRICVSTCLGFVHEVQGAFWIECPSTVVFRLLLAMLLLSFIINQPGQLNEMALMFLCLLYFALLRLL